MPLPRAVLLLRCLPRAALTETVRSTFQLGRHAGAQDITLILLTRQGAQAQPERSPHRTERAARSEWGDLTECRVMLNRPRSGRFTPEWLCLCVVLF
jgi:hypothetical protein